MNITPSMIRCCTAVFVLVAGLASAQQDFSKVQIKVTKVSGTVYMLEGSGGNIGVSVGDDDGDSDVLAIASLSAFFCTQS